MEKLNYSVEGEKLLDDFSLTVNKTDKIAFVGMEHNAKSALFDIISGEVTPESGDVYWGQTVSHSYLGKDNTSYFESTISITDWLRQYSPDQDEGYVRGFLGRMLFSGDDSLKPVNVLSGGEKVRCMLSKMMLTGANILILDEPTNHLDLEAITSLNEALIDFPGVVLFNSHDHEFVSSIANRIVEITPGGVIDRMTDFESYITDDTVKELRTQYYGGSMKKVNI